MRDNDTLDEIAGEFCEMMRDREVPILMAYIKKSEDGMSHIRSRHAASVIDLISLAAASVMVLSRSLSDSLNIDSDMALDLALSAVSDSIKATATPLKEE